MFECTVRSAKNQRFTIGPAGTTKKRLQRDKNVVAYIGALNFYIYFEIV